jgi:hypothetical protein
MPLRKSKNTRRSLLNRFIAFCGLCLVVPLFTGCPSLVDLSVPSSSSSHFTHFIQLNWDSADLATLQSLALLHVGEIELTTGTTLRRLSVTLKLDIQKDRHAELSRLYQKHILAKSQLLGSNPKVKLPDPSEISDSLACQKNEDGSVNSGICVEKALVIVPLRKFMDFELKSKVLSFVHGIELRTVVLNIPENAGARIQGVRGNIEVRGGGQASFIEAEKIMRSSTPNGTPNDTPDGDRPGGSFTSRLSSIARMNLTKIVGKVSLFLDKTDGAIVTLDGAEITKFPYQRQ